MEQSSWQQLDAHSDHRGRRFCRLASRLIVQARHAELDSYRARQSEAAGGRGSELALRRLALGGVEFRHGDIRNPDDLADAGSLDLLIECSADPSVQAGLAGGDRYLIDTNLIGTINCLDHARRHGASLVFL